VTYTVGYGKPPKETQFKKNESGNRKGRPKRSQRAADLFLETIHRKISVNENGSRRSMTKLEAAFTQTVNKAVSGNPRSMQILAQMLKMFGYLNPAHSSEPLIIRARIPLPAHLKTAEEIKEFKEQDWMQDRNHDDGDD
jgi:hypothetical protein